MTPLPATFVRTALLFLVAGFGLGGWMLTAPALGLPLPPGIRLMHIHFLTVGFFTNMVMGVAIWMFPAPPGAGRAGIVAREPWGWSAYGLLLFGLLLRAGFTFAPAVTDTPAGRVAVAVSAATQVAAAICFALAIWGRTQPHRRPPVTRPGKGAAGGTGAGRGGASQGGTGGERK